MVFEALGARQRGISLGAWKEERVFICGHVMRRGELQILHGCLRELERRIVELCMVFTVSASECSD